MLSRNHRRSCRQVVLTLMLGALIVTVYNGNRIAYLYEEGNNSPKSPPKTAQEAAKRESLFNSYPIVGDRWHLLKHLPNGTQPECKQAIITESPHHSSVSQPYPGYYNATLSFRRDSVLPCPYGYTIELNVPSAVEYRFSDEILAKKNIPMAWFVSNCHAPSHRSAYVDELKKLIRVDIYGACGTLQCPKGLACEQKIRDQYRFYLALENSICHSYISEKFWSQGFLDVIPIVLRRHIYSEYAPPHSFIAFDDFKSAADMAAYLQSLMTNNTAYNEYFKWKQTHSVVYLNGRNHDRLERPWGICRLCHLLWQAPRPRRIIDNIQKHWVTDAKCDESLIWKASKLADNVAAK